MAAPDPGTVEVAPVGEAVASVVWLHGLGADGHDFEPIVPQLGLTGVRFLFPHAPVRPVTLNGGAPLRAWFDIERLDFGARRDRAGIADSVRRVAALLAREEARGVPRARQFLAGFSQGGAVVLEYLLGAGAGLAGAVALSTFHPAAVEGAPPAAPGAPPIFFAHGLYDPVVPFAFGERTRSVFAAAGYAVTWKRYRMAHQVCPEEIADLGAWLRERLAAQAPPPSA